MAEVAVNAPYKYTIPIAKAIVGEDGKRRLLGAATGPEVDLESQRVHPSLIDKWVSQINAGQIDVVYDDWHRKDSATADLGVIEKAWKDDKGYMWVQVLLDEDNPVSQYIHKAAQKGKQYGMSIFGKATRFVDEVVNGSMVRTIMDGSLERIAHTTRPVWTPSFGTVLSKAVDTALSESASGDNSVSEANKTETPAADATPETTPNAAEAAETTDSGAATNPESGKAPEGATTSDNVAPVEKAVKPETKRDEQKMNKFVKLLGEVNALAAEIGLSGAGAEAAPAAETKPVEKAQDPESEDSDRFVRIEKAVADLGELVVKLANTPDGSAPGALRKAADVDPLAEINAIADPLERARMAFAVLHGENGGVR